MTRSPHRAGILLLAAGTLGALPAHGAAPPAPPQAQPTDVGQVSTGGIGAEAGVDIVPTPTGTRAQARQVKKLAPNEIEVQPQSEIQKLPDVNVAEALQRVPGISLETDTGEGRFINIRGLDADLNGTTFDGVRILPSNLSSPQGGGRAVAYDALPAGLVGSIELVTTLRPEDDAEALGGLVNLLPRALPEDGSPVLEATGGLGLEFLRDTQVLDYGVTIGGSFGLGAGEGPLDKPTALHDGFFANPKPFRVLFTDSQHNDFRGVDDWEPSYSDHQSDGAPDKLLSSVDLRRYLYNRRRFDRGGAFEFVPNDEHSYYFRYADAGYTEHAGKNYLSFSGLDSNFPVPPGGTLFDPADPTGHSFLASGAMAQRSSTDEEEAIGNRIIKWGGKDILFDLVKLDYYGAYSEGTYRQFYNYGSAFQTNPLSLSYDNITDPNHLRYHTTDGTDLLDPNNYAFAPLSNGQGYNRDGEWSGAMNITVPVHLFGTDEEFKTGAILRLRDRIVSSTSQNYAGLPTTPGLASFVSGPNVSFYDGAYTLGPLINEGSIRGLIGNPAFAATETFAGDAIANLQSQEHDNENVYAGYLQYHGSFGKLSVLTGIRLEQTFGVYRAYKTSLVPEVDASGNPVLDGSDQPIVDTVLTPNVNKHAYVDYFPSLQFRYAFSDLLIGRADYSTALARPGFDEITAATQIDISNKSVTIGNPGLGATYGENFDVALEYYLPRGGIASVEGFDKEFTGYILPHTSFGAYRDPRFHGATDIAINTYTTSGHSRVYGAELAYTQQFLFLPAPFDGFGIDSNFTYNQSEVMLRPNEVEPLPSTSPYNFNAAVFYEARGVNFRLASSYVSKDLFAIGASRSTDIFSQPRFRLDLGTSYDVTPHATLYFDAKNLTDTPLKFTEGGSAARPIQREFYGISIIGGVRAHF